MVQVRAKYDGKAFIPVEPTDVPVGKLVRLTIDDAEAAVADDLPDLLPAIDPATGKRRLGQQRGSVLRMADDFNDDLGDDFWLGREGKTP